MMRTCKFIQFNEYEVKCPDCGKHLSGTPERYEGRVICSAHGVGTIVARKLQTLADTLHMKFKECPSCLTIKSRMNINGVDWTEKNTKKLVEMIQANAASQGIKAPKIVLNTIIASAIKEERSHTDG